MNIYIKKLLHYVIMLLSGMTLLASCAIYRPEIQQGQIIEAEALMLLKPGMTKEEVQNALGTPLVTDTFNPDRWDYVLNIIGKDRTITKRERVTVIFADGVVSRVETIKPTETETEAEPSVE